MYFLIRYYIFVDFMLIFFKFSFYRRYFQFKYTMFYSGPIVDPNIISEFKYAMAGARVGKDRG